jgi:hypothetical protein
VSLWTFCIYPCYIAEELFVINVQADYHTIERTPLCLFLSGSPILSCSRPRENALLRLVPLAEILLCSGTSDQHWEQCASSSRVLPSTLNVHVPSAADLSRRLGKFTGCVASLLPSHARLSDWSGGFGLGSRPCSPGVGREAKKDMRRSRPSLLQGLFPPLDIWGLVNQLMSAKEWV